LADITTSGALSRHITEYLTTDKKVKYYKCKTLQNPDFCFNGTLYTPVDATYKADTVTKAGSVSLASKGIVSVGIKNADDQFKFIGLRPDEKQDGTEQFEICPELLEINGKSQTIDLSTRSAISSITTKYGSNLYVQRARQRLRIMMLADDTCESFKMTLRLYLTGLKVEYNEKLDEYWIFNADGKFRFRLGKPYLVDPKDMNPLLDEFGLPYQNAVQHSLTEVSKGEYLYVKETGKGFADVKLPKEFLVDADTVYSSTTDGYVIASGASWNDARDAVTGTAVVNGAAYVSGGVYKYGNYSIARGFFYYNLSALSGTVTEVSEKLYTYATYQNTGSVTKGTQADTVTTADVHEFSETEYAHVTHVSDQYNSYTYPAAGISDVQDALGSVHKSCLRQYNNDYLNSSTTSDIRCYVYSSEDTSGTKDPYLYVTLTAGATVKPHYYYLQQ
jgi:hypothetical protein